MTIVTLEAHVEDAVLELPGGLRVAIRYCGPVFHDGNLAHARIGVAAPKDVPIDRSELHEKYKAQRRAA